MKQILNQTHHADITTHPDYDIVTAGDLHFSITGGIVKKLLYTVVISLVGSEGAVDVLNLNFSEFELQCTIMPIFCFMTNDIHSRYIWCSTL